MQNRRSVLPPLLVFASLALSSLATHGAPLAAASHDQFGWALAAGDFNGDDLTDLAVGAPGRAPQGGGESGVVVVFHGTRDAGLQLWGTLGQGGLGADEAGDRFGESLAAGDFDGDGLDDLAVGAPNEDLQDSQDAGYVFTFRGGPSGLEAWNGLDQQGLGANEGGDGFGRFLEAGDFDGDGIEDLAVCAPFEAVGPVDLAGYVFTFQGTASGLEAWSGYGQKDAFGPDWPLDDQAALPDSRFGFSLAAGDLDGDGLDELALLARLAVDGMPAEQREGNELFVLGGTADGLQAWPRSRYSGAELRGEYVGTDLVGRSLELGDFDGDGVDDLAVGAPVDLQDSHPDEFWHLPEGGFVYIRPGHGAWRFPPSYVLEQDPLGVGESGDWFGESLAAGDFDGDGVDDLGVGSSFENSSEGRAFVFRGSKASGLGPWIVFSQHRLDVDEEGDAFGKSLAAGDFDGDGIEDLAVGAPGEGVSAGELFTFQGTATEPRPWRAYGPDGVRSGEATRPSDS